MSNDLIKAWRTPFGKRAQVLIVKTLIALEG